jgi:hypothetical protein
MMSTQDAVEVESSPSSAAPDTMEASSSSSSSVSPSPNPSPKSALRENIDTKGKNAYYYAHGHKATGPQWDGKVEPKLLSTSGSSKSSNSVGGAAGAAAAAAAGLTPEGVSFEYYYQNNITKYAFLDDDKKVKLYIDMEGVGEKCTDQDITLDFTVSSLSLVVHNYKQSQPAQCLRFGKLTADIQNATFLKKKDKIILTLTKAVQGEEWHTINDKG